MNTSIAIPEEITHEWIDDALKAGSAILPYGNAIFVRKMPNPHSYEEFHEHLDTFLDKKDDGRDPRYYYHGTNIEYLSHIVRFGLFGTPEVATLSTLFSAAARIRAEGYKDKPNDVGVITIWRILLKDLIKIRGDIEHTEMIMAIGKIYKGDRSEVQPETLKDAQVVTFIPPEDLVGVYVVPPMTRNL